VEPLERHVVARGARGLVGVLEHRAGERRRAGEPPLALGRRRSTQQRLEELAHDAEREARLELAAAGAEHAESFGFSGVLGGAQQARLPEAAGGLEHEDRAGALAGPLERVPERVLLGVSLQEDVRLQHGCAS
jgi:hypothetical protein